MIENLKKQGKCPENNPKAQRDWSLKVQNLLQDLLEMSETHDLDTQLRHSDVIHGLVLFLPKKAQEKYNLEVAKYIAHQNDGRPMLDTVEFEFFMNFLKEFQTLAKAMVTQSNTRWNSIISPAAIETKPPTKQKAHATVVVSETTQDSPPSKQQKSSDKSKPKLKTKDKKSKSQTDKKPKNDKKPKTLTEHPCTQCKGAHTHLLYCPEFQKATPKDRVKQTQDLKICYRCLKMNTEVDFNNRANWFAEHLKAGCYTKFICEEATCSGKTPDKQKHISVCNAHSKANSKHEADLIKSLSSAKLGTNAKFFFTGITFVPKGKFLTYWGK